MESSAALATSPDSLAPPTPQEHRFEFHGTGSEYFRIWIVNLSLTLITLGIYGAWAKVRRLRYFYGNTVLAGSSFEYHGEPKKILLGRAIAAALIAPYSIFSRTKPLIAIAFLLLFLLALPFIVVKSRRFQMRMSSWRNIRFGFDGTYGGAARVFLGLSLLMPFTLGLLLPYISFAKQRFVIGESRFGQTKFEFNARPGKYYRAYLVGLGGLILGLLAAIVAVVLVTFISALLGGAALGALLKDPRSLLASPGSAVVVGAFVVLIYIAYIGALLVPVGLVRARIANEAFSHTQLGPHQLQCKLDGWKLAGLYLGNLMLMVITLGLYAPWAKMRLLRYQLESMSVIAQGDLDAFVAGESASAAATGEELGEMLDIDFGL